MIESIWSKTYRRDSLDGHDAISIVTGVLVECDGVRTLVADLNLRVCGAGGMISRTEAARTSGQMHALAALLEAAATRVEDDLLPLLVALPEAA